MGEISVEKVKSIKLTRMNQLGYCKICGSQYFNLHNGILPILLPLIPTVHYVFKTIKPVSFSFFLHLQMHWADTPEGLNA